MFAGIVEAQARITDAKQVESVIRIQVEKPDDFNDLSVGDSVAVNGICLTIEQLTEQSLTFAVAAETLQVTGWTAEKLAGQMVNLERSLKLGARIHGHFVTGHVDAVGRILEIEQGPEIRLLKVEFPQRLSPMIWKKGSVAINGVSLTLNEVESNWFSVCLIPETLKRTNLAALQMGSPVMLEVDAMARGLVHNLERFQK